MQVNAILLAAQIVMMLATVVKAENLAPQAAYSVQFSGFAYRGQVIPGTNTPATSDGFMPAPPWQGPRDVLTDGKRDGSAARSWFWSAMKKRATLTFDLRRTARVNRIGVWGPANDRADPAMATACIADSEAGLTKASPIVLDRAEGGYVWNGQDCTGRFVRLICEGSEPEMVISEVEISGQATGAVAKDAPNPGLIPVTPRDLTPLLQPPVNPADVVNLAPRSRLVITSSHYDDKLGRAVDDSAARDSDPTGRGLVDGDQRTAVTSASGWYARKTIIVELELEQPAQVERVVAWTPPHGDAPRVYLNGYEVWLRPGPDAAWVPVGEYRNAVLPGEKPPAAYALATAPIGKPARSVRIRFDGVAQSADVLRVAEVEIWGKVTGVVATGPSLRVRKPVPAIEPVPLGELTPAYDWIVRDRIRGIYGYAQHSQDAALLERAKAEGFNCFIFHASGREAHSATGWPAICERWARAQQHHGLKVLASWAYGSDERYANTTFGTYQPGGREIWKRTPCPQSRDYWDRVVGDRAVSAAEAGLTGMVVDMEMYGADAARYPGPCYCDSCWGGFVEEHLEGVTATEIALRDRPSWMHANGLTRDYARHQEIVVTSILRSITRRVRAVKPDFLLGNMLDPESLPGLARGLGTPTMPALIFSELEYQGNLGGMPERQFQLRSEGYPALYAPGLWPKPVRADAVAGLIREAGVSSAGYWIWSALAFTTGSKGIYACHPDFKPDDYWRAVRAGNDALTEATKKAAPDALRGPTTMPAALGPRATIPRIATAPPSDKDWERAAILAPFLLNNNGQPPVAKTYARVLWDGKRLYVRVTCEEPAPEKIKPPRGERDDSTLWTQDSVEAFWKRPGSSSYMHIIANTAGTISDALADGLKPEDIGWNADIVAQARRTNSGWRIDLSVPLESDGQGVIRPGSQLRFELARNRPGGGETSCWAPTQGMFIAAPHLWGTLVLE